MRTILAAGLAAVLTLGVPAAATAAPARSVDRELVRVVMLDYLRDHPSLRREVCAVHWRDPGAAYRMLWHTRIDGIRQVYVRRGTRDAIDWICS